MDNNSESKLVAEEQSTSSSPENILHAEHEKIQYLTSCCFFFDLTLGSMLIGFVEALIGMAHMFGCTFHLHIQRNHTSGYIQRETNLTSFEDALKLFYLRVIGIATLCGATLLILGARYRRKFYLMIWLYITALSIVAFIIRTLIIDMVPERMIFDALFLALDIYFWFVVFSLYMKLKTTVPCETPELEVLYVPSIV